MKKIIVIALLFTAFLVSQPAFADSSPLDDLPTPTDGCYWTDLFYAKDADYWAPFGVNCEVAIKIDGEISVYTHDLGWKGIDPVVVFGLRRERTKVRTSEGEWIFFSAGFPQYHFYLPLAVQIDDDLPVGLCGTLPGTTGSCWSP